MAAGFKCGYVSERFTWDVGDQEEGRDGGAAERACRAFNAEADASFERELRPCDVVAVHNSHFKYTRSQYGASEIAGMVERLRQLHTLVARKGAKLLLLGDAPGIVRSPQGCAASAAVAATCGRTRQVVSTQFARERDMYTALVAENPTTTFYLPLWELFCDPHNGYCGAFVPGTTTVAYADEDHLGNAGSTYVWPFLCAFMQDHGLVA